VIETERLLLRPLTLADVDDLVAMHAHAEVERFMGPFDPVQARTRIESSQREWQERGHGMMAIIERAAGRFLGRTGMKYWPQFDETEVGWALRPDAWGRGIAIEAAQACVDWGFQNLTVPYLTALIRPDNARSIRVAERLGMSPLRPEVLLEIPVVVYAIERGASGHQSS
jgi:RimJ/RimL family protein N-acetyltransferase